MTCFHPIEAWKDKGGSITFKAGQGIGFSLRLPCGGCIGCRLDRTKQWAIRCVHEASLHEDNAFITLTYNRQHLPEGGSLDKTDYQKFMKRLRKHYEPTRPWVPDGEGGFKRKPIRFYHCGEYGEQLERPHYHALLFGFDFPDKYLWREVRKNGVYRSDTLERLWPFGFSSIGAVTYQSAAYVARYVMKKQNSQYAEHHYQRIDPETGEIFRVEPEYTTMSLKPGIGADWFKEFRNDVYPDDFVVHNGTKHKVPRFYDLLYERADGELAVERVKSRRVKAAREHSDNQTPARLAVREKVQESKVKLLKRELTDEA